MKQMRKVFFSLLMMISLFYTVPAVRAEGETEVIYIGNKDEFLTFLSQCNYDAWSYGKKFELSADINLSEDSFAGAPVFAGTLNGNGHAISGIQLTDESSPAGLFNVITKDGAVENLNVSATITPKGTQVNTGGIAGINYGIIRSCSFVGTVKGTRNTGGIAGINAASGMILNCSASGMLYGQTTTGGIAGYNLGTITSSENNAYVNTDADDAKLSVENISFGISPDMKSLISEENGIVRSDTGGIAGYSDGSVILCRNNGTVGYPQVGYNVGGIVGRSDGHLLNCTNNANVFGRKDIGGIVGQAEPDVSTNVTASTAAALSNELSVLETGVRSLESHAEETDAQLRNRIESISGYVDNAKDALTDITDYQGAEVSKEDIEGIESKLQDLNLSDLEERIDLDEIRSRTEAFRDHAEDEVSVLQQIDLKGANSDLIASVAGLSDQATVLRQEVAGKTDALVADANRITSSITSIETTLNNALYDLQHPEDWVQDTSDYNVESVLLGKIASCTNRGEVSGALNVGGIAGTMGIEYTADPEDDVSAQMDGSTKKQYELKCILERDVNTGAVRTVRNDIGGIAGRMDLGLILYCESYGDVSSTSGDEVGGIAGIAAAVVRNNYAKCRLSGGSAVGGIVGAGTAGTLSGSSSIVDSNISMVSIVDATESYGAVAGTDTGTFTNNVFVSDELAGINSASYAGRAEPISYESLRENYELPSAFQNFTLKFMADEEVLKEIHFEYGDSFTEADMPEIPMKDGMYAYYDRTDLTNLHQDTVVTAVYSSDLTALSSHDSRSNGRSIFYVKGHFDKDAQFTVNAVTHDSKSFEVVRNSLWNAVVSYIRNPGKGLAYDVLEQWHLVLPKDGASTHEVRYLLPGTLTGTYQMYLRTDGGWHRIAPDEIGSYAVFEVEGNEADLAVLTAIPGWWIYALLGYIVVMIGLIIAMHRSRDRRKKTHEAIRSRIAMDRRLQAAVVAASVFGIAVLGAGIWFLHSGAAGGVKAYQLIKEYTDAKPLVMEGSLNLKVGNQDTEETFLIQEDESGITVITMDDLSLYYNNDKLYLENGRAFAVGSLAPDYGNLMVLVSDIFEHASINTSSDGDVTVYSLTASQSDAEQLLKILLAEYADQLPDLKSVDVNVREHNAALSSIEFKAAGVLKDADKTAYDVQAVLTTRDPSAYTLTVPDAVKTAVAENKPADAVLTRDYMDLLAGWADLTHSESMSARVTISTDADLLSLNDTLQYHRSYNSGNPIRSIQKGNLIVYFNDETICSENGEIVVDDAHKKLAHTGILPELLYEITMNGSFDVSSADASRVFTIKLDEASISKIKESILAEHADLLTDLDSGTILIALNNGKISRINCTLSGTATVLEETIPVSISADATIDYSGTYSIPDRVKKALEE